ncbi:MAG: ABC transporter ATP-binding protein/permease [Desulfobulbaceae bacterium]|jgi:subfamily B ATP-binding cassette protein MsbA|nr:ABC transporter ATP-binding protein/permease [Desulfobulbaceae bacterium]
MTNKEILSRLLALTQPYRGRLGLACLAMVMGAAMTSLLAYLVKPVLDHIFIAKNSLYLNWLPLVVVAVFLLNSLFYYLHSFLLEFVGQSVVRDLRTKIFAHVQAHSLAFFHTYPTGTLISRVISDITLVQQTVSSALVTILRDFFQILFSLALICYLNWKLALISLLVLPVAAWPIIRFSAIFRRLSTRTQEETAGVSNRLFETITGNRIVKAFGREQHENRRFSDQIAGLFKVVIKDAQFRSLQHPLTEFIGGIAIACFIWIGGWEVLRGGMTAGDFFAFLTALISAYGPVKDVSRLNSTIQQGLAAAVRAYEVLDLPPDITDRPDAIELPPFKNEIRFERLSFAYENEDVLRDINLRVPTGQTLAIVGASGGGKTTLTNLIPRFIDATKGAVKIDGHDVREVTLTSLRQQVAIVTQQTILFNETARYNILYGNFEANEAAMRQAAEAAYALDFIQALPQGFDTVIGEGGARLSGGERQRLCIARAILKDAPILILDEATSALDVEAEHEVQKALENLMRGRTTFVIAHRLSTIKNADRIIVIKDGRIVEEGAHDTLLARQGEYAHLYRMQFS